MNQDQQISHLLNEYWESIKHDKVQYGLYVDYIPFHTKRYQESIRAMQPLLFDGAKVLELGWPGPFAYVFKKLYPNITLDYITTDLREAFDIERNKYDLLINMEVIEHIKDTEKAPLAWVEFDGVKSFIKESCRVLKPEGKMFVSTPNAQSYANLNKLFNNQPAWMWRNHFREYAVDELCEMLKEGGFSVLEAYTLDVWNQSLDHRYTRVVILLDDLKRFFGFSSVSRDLRKDNIFVVCQKPKE